MRFILTKTYVFYRGKENEEHIPDGSYVTLNKWHTEDKLFVNYNNDTYLVHIKDLIMANIDGIDKDNKVPKNCWVCESPLEHLIDDKEFKKANGETITIESVEYFECPNCNKTIYSSNVAEFIQKTLLAHSN